MKTNEMELKENKYVRTGMKNTTKTKNKTNENKRKQMKTNEMERLKKSKKEGRTRRKK